MLYGVVTEICVAYAARGLARRGYRLRVITDAIRNPDEAKSKSFLEEVSRVGGALSTVADLIGAMLRQPAA
jgi:nicotinamidase-related amidase